MDSAMRKLRAYVDTECPDQPAYLHSLIKAFTIHQQNHWRIQNVGMEVRGPDDTSRLWICTFCACLKALILFCCVRHISAFFDSTIETELNRLRLLGGSKLWNISAVAMRWSCTWALCWTCMWIRVYVSFQLWSSKLWPCLQCYRTATRQSSKR